MVDGTGESRFVYDPLGRLTESKDGHGHGDVVEYGYDLAEELTALAYTNGKEIIRTFDSAGRLESVTDWLGPTTTFRLRFRLQPRKHHVPSRQWQRGPSRSSNCHSAAPRFAASWESTMSTNARLLIRPAT